MSSSKRHIPTNNEELEVSRSIREAQPAHFMLKIESFSVLSESGMENFESDEFQAGGYKWKLRLYPNGNKERNANHHISLYLAISDTKDLPQGWEANVRLKFFVYDHIRDNYLTIQAAYGRTKRFHWMKTEWGFDQLLSLDLFKNTSNGYLFDDSCVFGAEVFAIKNVDKVECLSMVKKTQNNTYTWKINHFSAIKEESICSEEFELGEQKWKLVLYPKGCVEAKGKSLSLYLKISDIATLPLKWRVFAKYKHVIRDQVRSNHSKKEGSHWFCDRSETWGYPSFMLLSDLNDKSKGFMVNDTLIVEAEIRITATTKNLKGKRFLLEEFDDF